MLRVKNLKIIKSLGEGRFGKVCLLQDKETNQQYVVKISKREFSNENEKKSFSNSMITWSKMQNPTLLPLSSFLLFDFEKENYPLFITDYFPNGSLQKALDQKYCGQSPGKFTNSAQYIILLGIALGIQNLHSHQIYHGNLKPSNILLDKNFYPILSDFYVSSIPEYNLCNEITNISLERSLYTAPEVFKNSEISEKSDVYSFSLILYELIVGHRPYKEYKSLQHFREEVMNGARPEIFYFGDEDIIQFLSRCWSGIPSERPTFSEIYEKLLSEKFAKLFEANSDDVRNYLKLFEGKDDADPEAEEDEEEDECEDEDKTRKMEELYEIGNSLISSKNPANKQKSLKYLKQAAELGSVKAMKLAADIYSNVAINMKEAARMYKMAADRGDTDSMVRYSTCLSEGAGVARDVEKSDKYLKRAADAGHVCACAKYGRRLFARKEGGPSESEAERYSRFAADRGDSSAMEVCGIMLLNRQEYGEAAKYFKMAADRGELESMAKLGVLYAKMRRVDESAALLKKAADGGSAAAMFELGKMLQHGIGVKRDAKAAVRYYRMGAAKGNQRCCLFLGCALLRGDGVTMNRKEGMIQLRKAADAGNLDAACTLARFLLEEQDEAKRKEGVDLYELAVKSRHSRSMLCYGECLCEGRVVAQNTKRGLSLIKSAAMQCDDSESMLRYSRMLYNGQGFAQDKREAAVYLKKLADRRIPKAIKQYARMLMIGDGIPKNELKARSYLALLGNYDNNAFS